MYKTGWNCWSLSIQPGRNNNRDDLFRYPGKSSNYRRSIYLSAQKSIPTPIPAKLDAIIKELQRDNLAIKNEIARMQKESEWRSEVKCEV
ncbi:hypothetical protein Glove_568g3 [Diversispora epigaea]|uniref:Uncharacterized protein n=1 Tax=Diversispora epigaea TaxID=1348612 RepID=A0A397GD17_9GLOM|nr:hypothetical protein Glove_568g3 [Diversispora epigaea]